MLDKLKNNKKDSKDTPTKLRKPGPAENSGEGGGKIRGLVSKVSGNDKEKKAKPRPMPKPKVKSNDGVKLKPKTAPKGGVGLRSGSGLGGKGPNDDQKTLVGAIVFGVILIVLVSSLYYFLVYQPYQENLDGAKNTKYGEIDSYFKNGLASDPLKQTLTSQVASASTPEEVLAIDVIGPATTEWRKYQNQLM